jgi:hypothetical protein
VVPGNQCLLDLVIGVCHLFTDFEQIDMRYSVVSLDPKEFLREYLGEFGGYKFWIVFFIALGVLFPRYYLLLNLNEVEHEFLEGFIEHLSEVAVGHGQLGLKTHNSAAENLSISKGTVLTTIRFSSLRLYWSTSLFMI